MKSTGNKINYCNASGECTAPDYRTEESCRFAKCAAIYHGGCIWRAYFGDVCLRQEAQDAAEEQAKMTRTGDWMIRRRWKFYAIHERGECYLEEDNEFVGNCREAEDEAGRRAEAFEDRNGVFVNKITIESRGILT